MANCKVYSNNPSQYLKELTASLVMEEVDSENPNWKVTMKWGKRVILYRSNVATSDQLKSAFQAKFPFYNVSSER